MFMAIPVTLNHSNDMQAAHSFGTLVNCVWNVMAHAQKPDFVFRRNGRVHLNWRGRQFSRLLAAEVCASAVVMLDTPRSEVVWQYWLPTPFASFPFTSHPGRHRVPSRFNWTLPTARNKLRGPRRWENMWEETRKEHVLPLPRTRNTVYVFMESFLHKLHPARKEPPRTLSRS
jgi:hypothetical protein